MISFSFHFEFSTVSIEHTHNTQFFFLTTYLFISKCFFFKKKNLVHLEKKLIEGSAFLASIVDGTHQKKKKIEWITIFFGAHKLDSTISTIHDSKKTWVKIIFKCFYFSCVWEKKIIQFFFCLSNQVVIDFFFNKT